MSHLDMDLTPDQCRWVRQLRYIRRARGWSTGWLRHAFVERWGFAPPVLDSDAISFPDRDVVVFVREKLGSFFRDQGMDEATIDLRLEQLELGIARYDPSAVVPASLNHPLPAHLQSRSEPPPRVHLRGEAGSACGHLSARFLAQNPMRFTDNPARVMCQHCRRRIETGAVPPARPAAPLASRRHLRLVVSNPASVLAETSTRH